LFGIVSARFGIASALAALGCGAFEQVSGLFEHASALFALICGVAAVPRGLFGLRCRSFAIDPAAFAMICFRAAVVSARFGLVSRLAGVAYELSPVVSATQPVNSTGRVLGFAGHAVRCRRVRLVSVVFRLGAVCRLHARRRSAPGTCVFQAEREMLLGARGGGRVRLPGRASGLHRAKRISNERGAGVWRRPLVVQVMMLELSPPGESPRHHLLPRC
jgi:hypothetical protein